MDKPAAIRKAQAMAENDHMDACVIQVEPNSYDAISASDPAYDEAVAKDIVILQFPAEI